MDETYRRFDSGRYGVVQADLGIYQTQIEGAKGVSSQPKKEKKDMTPEEVQKENERTNIDKSKTENIEPKDMYSNF